MSDLEEISPTRARARQTGVKPVDPARVPPPKSSNRTVTPLTSEEKVVKRPFPASRGGPHARSRVTSFAPGVSVGAMYDTHLGTGQHSREEDESAEGRSSGAGFLPPLASGDTRRGSAPTPGTSAATGYVHGLPSDRRNTVPNGDPRTTTSNARSAPRHDATYAALYDLEDSDEYGRVSPAPAAGPLAAQPSFPSYYLFSQFGKDPAEFGDSAQSGDQASGVKANASAGGVSSYNYSFILNEFTEAFSGGNAPAPSAQTTSDGASAQGLPPRQNMVGPSRYEWNSFVDKPHSTTAAPKVSTPASPRPAPKPTTPASRTKPTSQAQAPAVSPSARRGDTALSVFRRTVLKSSLRNQATHAMAAQAASATAYTIGAPAATVYDRPMNTQHGSTRNNATSHGDEYDDADEAPPLTRIAHLAPGTWAYVIRFAHKLSAAREAKLRAMAAAPSVFAAGRLDENALDEEEPEVEVDVDEVLDDDGQPMAEPTMSMLFDMNMSDSEDEGYEEDANTTGSMGEGGFAAGNMPSVFPMSRRKSKKSRRRPQAYAYDETQEHVQQQQQQQQHVTVPPPQYGQPVRPFQRPNMQAAFMQQQQFIMQQQQQQQMLRRQQNAGPATYIDFRPSIPPVDPQPNIFGPPLRGRKPPPPDFARLYGWRLSNADWVDSPRGGA